MAPFRMARSRTERLLELLGLVQTRTRFTAAELARDVGVSRRTILRDLQTLETLGTALEATPGPGGGYRVPWGRRRLVLSFSLDEALALVIGHDAVRSLPAMPRASLSDQAVTKIRVALPADVAEQLTTLRQHLALHTPSHAQTVPCFDELLDAAMTGSDVSIVYESISAEPHRRTVSPVGLYAEHGLWYCACRERGRDLTLRADRISNVQRLATKGPSESLTEWFGRRRAADATVTVRAQLTARGNKRHEIQPLLERARWQPRQNNSWEIEAEVEANDIDYWVSRFMALGTDVRAIAPKTLVQRIRLQAQALVKSYSAHHETG